MEHKIYRVVSFKPLRLFILQNEKFFNQVEIDPEVHTLVWPIGADFDPAALHDWPEYIGDHVAS